MVRHCGVPLTISVMDLPQTSPALSRRRLLRHTLAAAAAAGTALAASPGAFATTGARRAASLPEVGQTFTLSLNAYGVTLIPHAPHQQGGTVNLIGSQSVQIIDGGADFVRYQLTAFTMQTDHPAYGKITLQLPDIVDTPDSTLRLTPDGESLTDTFTVAPKMTLMRSGDVAGPFTYDAAEPILLTATIPAYPPPAQDLNSGGPPAGGALYRASGPARFTNPGSGGPDAVIYIELQDFNANQGVVLPSAE